MIERRWRLSVTSIATIGLLQLALLGLVSVYLVKRTLVASEASQQAVTQSNETISRLSELFHKLQDAETNERGFVITGNIVFLVPYQKALTSLTAGLRTLQTSGDTEQQLFAQRITAKLAYSVTTIAVRRQQGLAATVDRISSQNGKRLMDAARAQLARMISSERQRLAQRLIVRQRQQQQVQTIIYAVLATAQLVSIGIGALLIVYYRRRRDAERVARQRASLLRATLENVEIGIALLADDGSMRDWNARLAELTAMTDDGPVLDERIPAAARRHEAIKFETKNAGGVAIEVRGLPAPDQLYVVTYTDISERKRSDQLKSDFVSTVSHELRTPLTAIRGALGLLAGPLAKNLPARVVPLLEIADRNAVRLTGLVNDLLDIDKIEAGRLRLELAPVDLNMLAVEAAEANRNFAVQRGIRIAVGCPAEPVVVSADGSRLHQVITNLVSNAAKFSPQNGIVTITVERTSAVARVSVRDEGPGIPEEFNARIFGKFAQAASGDTKPVGGSGLGLSISKSIIEQHGGEIGFESRPGTTAFHFILSLDQPSMESSARLLATGQA